MREQKLDAPSIERGRRCQNCSCWTNSELAIQQYKIKRHADLTKAAQRIVEQGGPLTAGMSLSQLTKAPAPRGKDSQTQDFSDLDSRMQALGLNYELGDSLMRAGRIGICMIGAAPGDFVEFSYLCDKWRERVKPDGADKPDELPQEAKDRLGYDK